MNGKAIKVIYFCLIAILIIILLFLLVKLYPIYALIFSFLGRILLPFIIAAFISYLLYPIIDKLHQYHINKSLAIAIIYLLFFLGGSIAFYKSFPIFVHQLQDLSEHLPQFALMYENIINSLYDSTAFLPELVHEKITDMIVTIESSMEKQIGKIVEKAANIVDFIVFLTIIPVLVFYFLKDFVKMKLWFKQLLPLKHHAKMEQFIRAIDDNLGGYVRGQLIISSVIMFFTFLIYHTFQLKYALVLAVIMGLMNVIPYFGPIIGTIPVVLIAMTTSWKLVIVVIVTNIIVQLLENSFLSPYIMGKSIQIHPIIIILTLLIGAEVGGVIGMIIAVPFVTILKAIFTQFFPKKQQCN